MSGNILTPGSARCFRRSCADAGPGIEVRRTDALVAPGDGNGVRQVRGFLHPGPDTVRGWPRGFRRTGLASVDPAAYPEREGKLTRARDLQHFTPVSVIRMAYMAGHAGRSPPFRFADA